MGPRRLERHLATTPCWGGGGICRVSRRRKQMPVLPEFIDTDALVDEEEARVHQGDVIAWLEPEAPWKTLGVVVTADCDIVQSKHGGLVSYVPALDLESYLGEILLPKRLRTAREKKLKNVLLTMHGLQRRIDDTAVPLSAQGLEDWLETADSAAIAGALGAEGQRRVTLEGQLDALRRSKDVEPLSAAEQLELLGRLKGDDPRCSRKDLEAVRNEPREAWHGRPRCPTSCQIASPKDATPPNSGRASGRATGPRPNLR